MIQATAPQTAADPDAIAVLNPATEEVLEEVSCTTPDELEAVLQQAQAAFAAWREDDEARRAALRRGSEVLRKRSHSFELANLLTREQGKPKREAIGEVYAAAHWLASMADLDLPAEVIDTEQGRAEIRHLPQGVVAAITPWNYPLLLAAAKIGPALRAGNTMVLKPSPYTPLATRRMVELLNGAGAAEPILPPGVLTVVVGGAPLGSRLIEAAQVSHVSFTGSVEIGGRILAAAAALGRRVTLELGGNDAALVLADADLEKISEPLFWGAFTNAGQFCVGIKRLYVARDIFDEVRARLVERAAGLRVGDGSQAATQMGPLANEPQFARVVELVDDARRAGATIAGGEMPDGERGYFYPPTIISDVTDGTAVVDQEQFGPLLPVMPFDDLDEAVARANNTPFGLGGSVWTRDAALAADVAHRLECGTVWINQHGALDPRVPFGGHKQSGQGLENGLAGLLEFTTPQVVYAAATQGSGS